MNSPPKMAWFKYSAFFQMMGISASSLIPLFWKEILHYEADKIGFLNAIATAIALSGPLFFGWAGTRQQIDKTIKVCFILSAVLSPFFLSSQSFWLQAVLFTGISFLRCGFTTLVPVGVLNLLSSRAGQEYGKYRRVGSMGFLVGVIGAGYLAKATNPSWVLAILGGSALFAVYPYLNRIEIPQAPQRSGNYRDLLKIPGMLWFYLGTLLISTWSSAAFIFMPLRLSDLGASASTIGWVVSECGIVALFTLSYLGKMTDRYSPAKLYLWVPLFAFLRIFLYGLPTENASWFFLIQLLHIPTWVISEVIQVKTLRSRIPNVHFSRGMALLQVSQSLGLALGSGYIGLCSGHFGLQQAFRWGALLPLFALPFLYLFYVKTPLNHSESDPHPLS